MRGIEVASICGSFAALAPFAFFAVLGDADLIEQILLAYVMYGGGYFFGVWSHKVRTVPSSGPAPSADQTMILPDNSPETGPSRRQARDLYTDGRRSSSRPPQVDPLPESKGKG